MFALQEPKLNGEIFDWAGAKCHDGATATAHGVVSLVEMFFSDEIPDIAAATAICRECPLQEPCFAGALERREPWGVWGGELFNNGKVLAQKRKRGRPPKNPQVARDVA